MLLHKRDESEAKERLFLCIRDRHEELFGGRPSVTRADCLSSYSAWRRHDGVGDRLALEALGLLLNKVIHVHLYSLGAPEWSTCDYSDPHREAHKKPPLRLFLDHKKLGVLKPLADVNPNELCPCKRPQEHYNKD